MHTDYHNKRNFYANDLFSKKTALPFRYVLILTNKCNLACSFCFQERKNRKDAMTTDDWLKLINQLPDYAHVTLTGGEPLVFKDFKKIFQETNKKFTTNIISNGLLLNEDNMELISSSPNFKVLSISIDDIGNKGRNVKEQHWARMETNLQILKNKVKSNGSNMLLDAKTVVLDDNSDDLFEIYKYLVEKLEVDTHSFQILKGSPVQHADIMFPYSDVHNDYEAYEYKKFDKILEQFEKVREYNLKNKRISYIHPEWLNLNTDKTIHEQNSSILNLKDHDPKNFKLCKAPWESIHVNVDGTVFPCLAINMGNVKEQNINSIINGEKFNKFKNDLISNSTFKACNRCGYLKLKT